MPRYGRIRDELIDAMTALPLEPQLDADFQARIKAYVLRKLYDDLVGGAAVWREWMIFAAVVSARRAAGLLDDETAERCLKVGRDRRDTEFAIHSKKPTAPLRWDGQ